MEIILKRFMYLSYGLHLMGVEIDIDEAGLELHQFEKIDELFEPYLETLDAEAMKTELISLVNMLTKGE